MTELNKETEEEAPLEFENWYKDSEEAYTPITSKKDLWTASNYEILKNICYDYNLVLQDPTPFVEVSNFLDSAIEIRVRVWVKSEDYWKANWYLLNEFKNAFDENNITIPFKQVDVNIKKD